MARSSEKGGGPHILVFPYPAQGHMLPILDLTHELALRGLSITLVVTPKNVAILNPLLSVHPSIQIQVFPFPDHPSLPPGVENVRDIGNHGNGPIFAALSKLQDPLIKWLRSQINKNNNPPIAIVSDFFLGWTHNLAHQIGIPRICFYSSGTFLAAVLNKIWTNFETFHNSFCDVKFHDLPHSPCFPYEQLPSVFRRYQETNPDSRVVKNSMIANISSWASVFSTFDALEGEFSEYLKESMGHDRVFQVGPLNLLGVRPNAMAGGKETSYILKWLDECKEDESVLYVCFGSQKFFKKGQIEALANGLERSGVRFVWVTKPVTAQQLEDGYASVPDGFEDRVSGQGLVVKEWAPQMEILSHRAVGGFLSHCGWNSMLEAVTAGVMIIGWPMEADQFINAKLMVDYLGAAVRVSEGVDTVPDSVELARKINESMSKDKIERVKAKELKKKAFEAVGNGGSSVRDIDGLVYELIQLANVSSEEEEDLVEDIVPISSNGVSVYAK